MGGSVALRVQVIACAFVLLAACSDSGGGSGDDDANGSGGSSGNPAGGAGGMHGGASGNGGGTGGRASGSGGHASGTGGNHAGSGGTGGSGSGGQSAGSGGAGDSNNAALPQIGGCDVFTADDAWNRDISGDDADPEWTDKLHALVGDANIHPDYGNSGDEHYGIPINVVPESQPLVEVEFDGYPEESDPGPWPLPDPSEAKIEGGSPDACDGDCHFNVVQSGACMLFEGYACSNDGGGWRCANGAKWDLTKNSYGQRPKGWTSADAAGLAITAGVLRYDEVKAGEVKHAIRFTVECTRDNFVAPASHHAVPSDCDASDPNAPPMGLRVRLKSDYDISGLSDSAQVVARAMQTYGMIIADNGSNFFFQGEDNPGWTEDDVEPLKSIPASAFEALVPGALEE